MTRAKILRGLARILVAIGGWVLRVLARKGLDATIAYLDARADHLAEREKRARAGSLRREWLHQRVLAWRRAVRWLRGRAYLELDDALGDAEERAKAAIDRIPDKAEAEDFRRWKRARAR